VRQNGGAALIKMIFTHLLLAGKAFIYFLAILVVFIILMSLPKALDIFDETYPVLPNSNHDIP
jgi:hypothetical protein